MPRRTIERSLFPSSLVISRTRTRSAMSHVARLQPRSGGRAPETLPVTALAGHADRQDCQPITCRPHLADEAGDDDKQAAPCQPESPDGQPPAVRCCEGSPVRPHGDRLSSQAQPKSDRIPGAVQGDMRFFPASIRLSELPKVARLAWFIKKSRQEPGMAQPMSAWKGRPSSVHRVGASRVRAALTAARPMALA